MNKLVHEGELRTFIIQYKGIPEAGLEIKNNRYGDRTFFCESWPNNRVARFQVPKSQRTRDEDAHGQHRSCAFRMLMPLHDDWRDHSSVPEERPPHTKIEISRLRILFHSSGSENSFE